MKKWITIMVLLAVLAPSAFAKGFGIERAIINYKVTSSDQQYMGNGTMEIAYDKFGQYMATTTKAGGINATTIISPDGEYMINWDDKTAMDLSMFGDMGDDMLDLEKEDEGKIIGTETVLGKKCTVHLYQDDEGTEKYWLWEGIPLRMISEFDGIKTTMEATSVSTPSSIPASKFTVPKGIEIQKMPSFSFPVPGME